jgi:mannose-6-phosphate isomerase
MGDGERAAPPWGAWRVLDEGERFKVKRIEVLPGKRLSYQKHFKREEHWYVVKGCGLVTLDGNAHTLEEGDCIIIPAEAFHRIENAGDATLVFIEVQRGDYLGEDDIVRISDDYGRAG